MDVSDLCRTYFLTCFEKLTYQKIHGIEVSKPL